MIQKSWFATIATLGPIGSLKGCGTIASLLTLPLVIALYSIKSDFLLYESFLLLLVIACLYCIQKALAFFPGEHDPRAIVIDELVGCFITFYGIHLNGWLLVLGFLLFRFFDIVKPLGISSIERWKAPWGILADDIVAALIANVCLRIIIFNIG